MTQKQLKRKIKWIEWRVWFLRFVNTDFPTAPSLLTILCSCISFSLIMYVIDGILSLKKNMLYLGVITISFTIFSILFYYLVTKKLQLKIEKLENQLSTLYKQINN